MGIAAARSRRHGGRRVRAAGTAVALAAAAAACGGGSASRASSPTPGVRRVSVTVSKAGCGPARLELPAGPTIFEVRRTGAGAASRMEIQHHGRVLGEVEALAPGRTRSFGITLQPGTYDTVCPNGTRTNTGQLVVTGAGTHKTKPPARAAVARATATYRSYVGDQATRLVDATTGFVAAVKSGDVAAAKRLYAGAHTYYETIELVAQRFGYFALVIDGRAGDVRANELTGFHRIEKQLWESGNTDGMGVVADDLLGGVQRLRSLLRNVELGPAQIANAAVELLNGVVSDKITGGEDHYAHTDLWDFDANLRGARAAFEAVRPILAGRNGTLVATIDERFASTAAALDRHRAGGGFRLITELTPTQTRALAARIEGLADSLSEVPPLVGGP